MSKLSNVLQYPFLLAAYAGFSGYVALFIKVLTAWLFYVSFN